MKHRFASRIVGLVGHIQSFENILFSFPRTIGTYVDSGQSVK